MLRAVAFALLAALLLCACTSWDSGSGGPGGVNVLLPPQPSPYPPK